MRLIYSPSLCIPRNPNAFQPYGDVEYVMQGCARLIYKRKAKKDRKSNPEGRKAMERNPCQGADLLAALCGWTDSAELLAALATPWEPDNSFSIYS